MKKLLLFLCSLVAAAAMQAQIIHVPGDYPTIQQGINAANPGDTVLVSEGTYYEQINFLGKKPLMVASQFLMDGDTSHIKNTIIDGSQLTNMDSASVVYFVSGEDTTSILCGFTIQHGKGTYTPDNDGFRQGGGIWISEAGAKIIHNRITHNILDDTQPGNGNSTAGGGIGSKYAEGSYWLVIRNNTIDSNTCISKYSWTSGGGVSISYNSRIHNNVISYNTCSGIQNATAAGVGIWCEVNPSWTNVVAFIENNTITHNLAQSQNNWAESAGVQITFLQCNFSSNEVAYNTVITGNNSGAGAVFIAQPDPGSVVSNNVFKENVGSNVSGGGLAIENIEISENTVLIENNYFTDNVAEKGGAFMTWSIPVILQNNVFNGNHGSLGGAIYLRDDLGVPDAHMATLINNSFSGNTANISGGGIYSYLADPFILNSIFWEDSASFGKEIYTAGGTVEIAYSDIDPDLIFPTYIDGGGNINEDPLFEDLETLNIEVGSPCIDAGISSFTCNHGLTFDAPGYDILGIPRPQGTGYDMGAYEPLIDRVRETTKYEFRITNYPNPVNESTTFSYFLIEPALVTIQLFNSFGQLVTEPLHTTQVKGEQHVQWNANDLPAGIYQYRIQAGPIVGSGKMIKL